jgi:hypothetical protein
MAISTRSGRVRPQPERASDLHRQKCSSGPRP